MDLIAAGRKTILQEAQALAGFVDTLDERFAEACELIFQCKGTVLLTGMGKSGLVARKWAATFSGTGTKSYYINPAEAPHGDLGIVHPEDVLIALSFSGETEELSYLLKHAREMKVALIGVTGRIESSLARQTSITLSLQVSEEACPLGLAPTTSTTLMMALGDALAVSLMQMRGFTERDFARLHPGGSLGRRLWLRVGEIMHSGTELPVVKPENSMDEVLIEMTRKCLGLAVVMENEQVLGVITDGDLRRFLQKDQARNSTAKSLMTPNPKFVTENALAVEAREIMEAHSIRQLLVYNTVGRLVGVLHLHDLMKAKVL